VDEDQTMLPPSFIALHIPPGRSRPSATREQMAARYDFCEDLVLTLVEHAQTTHWQLGITEADVLERIGRGLVDPATGVSELEAPWVLRRLAELLEWDQ